MNFRRLKLFVFICLSLLCIDRAVALTDQTITFPPIATQSTTNPIFTLGATSSSGMAVVYTVVAGKDIATVSGNTVTLTGAPGAVTIRADQWGNNKFAMAPTVYQDFTVVKNLAGSPPWRSIAYGSGTVFAVKNDGTLWAWGYNSNGSLGDGTNINKSVPEQIGTDTNWQSVEAYYQTVALKTDGTLWTWGYNYYGELGNGNQLNTDLPKQVGTSTWKAIAAGYGYTLAIGNDGTLWEAGNGMGSNTTDTFIQIGTDNHWSSASASYSHALLVKTDGTLWGMGDNSYGELGIGTTSGPYYGTYQLPVQIGSATNWKLASAGDSFSAAVKTDGTLWTWGVGNQYQLGDGSNFSPVTSPLQLGTANNWQSVSAGLVNSIATKTDGTLWAWGDNQDGEVGDGTTTPRYIPEQIGTDTIWQLAAAGSLSIATKSDGTLWSWGASSQSGYGFRGIRPIDATLGSVASYAAGIDHCAAVRTDGTLWAWGKNQSGQLGDGTTTNQPFPEQVSSANNWASVAIGQGFGGDSTFAIKTDGTLWAWGNNDFGQLGDGTTQGKLVPEQIGLATNWKSVSGSYGFTLAVKTDGTLWAWGSDFLGELGVGPESQSYFALNPLQVGTDTHWKSVSAGADAFAVAIKTDGTLWTWGGNLSGQLSNGTTNAANAPQMVGTDNHWQSASAGGAFVVALKTDGTLWTWGDDTNGQLGTSFRNYLFQPVQVGRYTTWTKAVASESSVFATQSNGSLWAWGNNAEGQLGDGGVTQQYFPEQIGLHAKWSLAGNNGLSDLTTLASTTDGTLWGWGDNNQSELAEAALDNTVPQRTIPGVAAQYLGIVPLTAPIGVPVEIFANATSELPVTFNVSGPATLSGHFLTVTGPGTVNLMGYQPGDVNWASSGPVTAAVTVVPGPAKTGPNGG